MRDLLARIADRLDAAGPAGACVWADALGAQLYVKQDGGRWMYTVRRHGRDDERWGGIGVARPRSDPSASARVGDPSAGLLDLDAAMADLLTELDLADREPHRPRPAAPT